MAGYVAIYCRECGFSFELKVWTLSTNGFEYECPTCGTVWRFDAIKKISPAAQVLAPVETQGDSENGELQSPAAFIERKIKDAFRELAGIADNLDEDQAAGLPMALFKAEQYLIGCWQRYVETEPSAKQDS